jgi:hypothetical protein
VDDLQFGYITKLGKRKPWLPNSVVFTNCSNSSGYGKSIATEVLVDSILVSIDVNKM